MVDALETCEVDHNKVLIKSAMKSLLNKMLLSFLDDSKPNRESFEDAIF